jgi:hypothetical protein
MPTREVKDFIAHWSAASPSERANSQPFLLDLCDLLDVPRPDPHPATPADLANQFKRAQPADVVEILETLVTLGRARKNGQKFSR